VVKALLAVALVACGSPGPPRLQAAAPALEPAADPNKPYRVTLGREVVSYDGPLDAAGIAELRRAGPEVKLLRIRSSGGDVDLGMDLAEWVLERGLDVEVDGPCLSSCANYIFPAGRRKVIAPGGVVAWHGSARQTNMADQLDAALAEVRQKEPTLDVAETRAQMAAYMKRVIARQDAFFARIGVAECVTRIGQLRLGAPGLFTMSIADMARFGIGVASGPTSAAELTPKQRTQITFVAVGDLDPATACDAR
jgi:hypothetical protein